MKPLKIVGILCLFMVLFLSFSGVKVYAASVEAVYGSTPTINGIMAPGEWIDASTVTFSGPSGTCTVYVKQNVTHLNIAIHVPDNTVDQFDWFEVCLDTNHDNGSRPQTDDYGLLMTRGFVSHLRQESVGDGLNWVSQMISGWHSSAAWTNSDYTIELSIGYTKLGITAGIEKTLGVEFQVWDDSGSTKYRWTAGSDNSNPSTWGEVTSHWSYPIYQGDLVLTGNNVTVIEGRFDINGSIIVEENASLLLNNALLNFTSGFGHGIYLQNPSNGNPRLIAHNTTIIGMGASRFYGNGSVLFSNCSVFGPGSLYFYDEFNVTIFDSNINKNLQARDSSKVTIFNSTIELLNLNMRSANSSINNLKAGFFDFWDFWLNCSVVVSPSGRAPNVTLNQTTILEWSFSFQDSSHSEIFHSEIWLLHANENAHVSLYNSTMNEIELYWNSVVELVNSSYILTNLSGESKVYASWYLSIHVVDSILQDVPLANISVTFPNATLAESKGSDVNGWARFTLLEKMMNATGDYPVGNYTVEATYGIYSDQTTVNMTENQQTTLTLVDFIIPEFPAFLITLLFMITTLVAVTIYRRKHTMEH